MEIPPELLEKVPPSSREALAQVLTADPRPHYHKDPQRVYGMGFAGMEVRFTVDQGLLRVVDVARKES